MNARIRFCLVGLNQTPLDWIGNRARIVQARDQARRKGAQLIIYPELAITGYGCEDRFLHRDTQDRAMKIALDLARETKDEVLLLGLPFLFEGERYNGIAILNQGEIRGIVVKSHLARDGIHYEPRWFRPWTPGRITTMRIADKAVPIGTLTFQAAGLPFGLEICEDAWVSPAERPCRYLRDAAWVFNSSASHFSLGKADLRETLVREASRRFGVGYAYSNLVGCESGRAIYDGEQLIAQHGEIVNRSDRLYLDDVHLLFHDINYVPRKLDEPIALEINSHPPDTAIPMPHTQRITPSAEEEFAKAASLALLDYMRKSRSRGFTLSLSGGVDSSVVAVLVYVMVQRLFNELNESQRRQKLGYMNDLPLADGDEKPFMSMMLTTAYQATRNSGDVTRTAAETLSHAIGARHLELDVDPMVEHYKSAVAKALGRDLDWQRDDIALQNIQARVRAPSVWMLANISGSLLLSTSNRSEVAVGYATMDGDTCGGLSPIAGIEKTFLRHWLVVMEREGLEQIAALPELSHVNNQQPTAELRPPEAHQSDEDDLMPYPILDQLEANLIAWRKTPVEAFIAIHDRFGSQYSDTQLYDWTRRFCRLFAITQWKRERYAPAFHLDDRNLDPKTWARYPILTGVFEAELQDLEAYFESFQAQL